jgi:hypothetical protein
MNSSKFFLTSVKNQKPFFIQGKSEHDQHGPFLPQPSKNTTVLKLPIQQTPQLKGPLNTILEASDDADDDSFAGYKLICATKQPSCSAFVVSRTAKVKVRIATRTDHVESILNALTKTHTVDALATDTRQTEPNLVLVAGFESFNKDL